MANESVLPLDNVNEIHKLLMQATAIVELIAASPAASDELTDSTMSSACWAVRDMLTEVSRLATGECI